MMGDKINVMEGSDNVFADLDVSEPEQALAKAELARKIGDVIQHRRLTQTRAAKLLGIDQPKVSALIRGRLTGFSTDRLMRFLIVLGRDVDIVVRATRRSKGRGRLKVV